jgi:hypothetical protein
MLRGLVGMRESLWRASPNWRGSDVTPTAKDAMRVAFDFDPVVGYRKFESSLFVVDNPKLSPLTYTCVWN